MKKQKDKKKSTIWKIFKIVWLIIFILIILWTLFWFAQLPKSGNLGEVVIYTAFFAVGLYALAIFVGITILIWLIKFFISLIRGRK